MPSSRGGKSWRVKFKKIYVKSYFNIERRPNHAQRTSGGAYDFARFERAQAAPQRVPARPQKTPRRLTKVPEPRKDALQRQRENIDSLRRTVKTILVSGLLISLLGGMLYSEVRQDELTHAYRQLENQMAIAQSENTRLNMELSAKLSLDKVEAYAAKSWVW